MIVLRCCQPHDQSARNLILVFGVGLIGHSIVSAFRTMHASLVDKLPFNWAGPGDQEIDLDNLSAFVATHCGDELVTIDIVWAAGRGGFTATEAEMSMETAALGKVLSFAQRLERRFRTAKHAIHLVSSAGGLFEGQINVNNRSSPAPHRPYAEAKLQQEEMLSLMRPRFGVLIYRPSTVYGFGASAFRQGLVITLIRNALAYRVTRIFGRLETIRDFVLADDVGRFIASKLACPDVEAGIFLLASGKPTTIAEIIGRIERALDRKVYREVRYDNSNIADNSFAPCGLPELWAATWLDAGIRYTARRIMSGGLEAGS